MFSDGGGINFTGEPHSDKDLEISKLKQENEALKKELEILKTTPLHERVLDQNHWFYVLSLKDNQLHLLNTKDNLNLFNYLIENNFPKAVSTYKANDHRHYKIFTFTIESSLDGVKQYA